MMDDPQIPPTEAQVEDLCSRLPSAISDIVRRLASHRDTLAAQVRALEAGSTWTDAQCFRLNAGQHNDQFHPYTCGKDSRHRPLIATRFGWQCADCDYRQNWAHGVPAINGLKSEDN